MKKFLLAKDNYFVFYAITFSGSALSAVSSFLMVEKLVGSLAGLGLALALKTAFMALASPLIARRLARMKMSQGFALSQILGPFLLLPLGLGIYLQNQSLFLAGIALGGLPSLILSIMSTTYLRLGSGSDLAEFRKNQGNLQLVMGCCFAASALLAPFLLKYVDYESVLFIDLGTYIIGLAYVSKLRHALNRWDESSSAAIIVSPEKAKKMSAWELSTIVAGISISMAYLLKGVPPLLAGHGSMTSSLVLDPTLRRSFWFYEALAGICAGLIYKPWHARMARLHIFDFGLMSGAWLFLVVLFPTYLGISFSIFVLSLSMTLTFMKTRDDFIARFSIKEKALWAAGYVNFMMNAIMTLSPLLIGALVEKLGPVISILSVTCAQVLFFIIIHFFRDSDADKTNLSKKIQRLGSKSILSFLLLTCALMAVILLISEKRRADRQIQIWTQNLSRSVITDLVINDYVPIYAKLRLLQETGLFREFKIYNRNKTVVASFSQVHALKSELTPIKDEAGSIWGYFSYDTNIYYWLSSLSILLPSLILSIGLIAFIARRAFIKQLGSEMMAIGSFVAMIEARATALKRNPQDANPELHEQGDLGLHELNRIRGVIDVLTSQIEENQRQLFEHELQEVSRQQIEQVSKQVAHDIRSPLSALTMSLAGLEGASPERRQLIQNAIHRINDIANDLLSTSRKNNRAESVPLRLQPTLISEIVSKLISEKRIQYRNLPHVEIVGNTADAFGVFASIDGIKIMRILSNLIDNSVEALINGSGEILLSVSALGGRVIMRVQDNGSGIPETILAQVGKRGFSHGKKRKGNGLGIFGAKELLAKMGGRLSIRSTHGRGTTIDLELPSALPPKWFPNFIRLRRGQHLVSLDDEITIHQIWAERTQSLKKIASLTLHQAFSFTEGEKLLAELTTNNHLVLVDYSIDGELENGLEFIERLSLHERAILVTSAADDPALQAECIVKGIKLLSKSLAAHIPIILDSTVKSENERGVQI